MYFILVLLLGVSLWLAYEFPTRPVAYADKDHAEWGQIGVAVLHLKFGEKEVAWPANYVFLGLTATFAGLLVATAITQSRRAARKTK
jgi:hypothetical protein